MSRETHYTAIVLKKQSLGEADEIVTFFTQEFGKIRVLAKSIKLHNAKLQNAVQAIFLLNITVAGKGNLPKIIGAQIQETFATMRANLLGVMRGYYACELVLKFMPDAQKNPELFSLLLEFFRYLNTNQPSLDLALAKFKIGLLASIGLSPSFHNNLIKQPGNLDLCNSIEKVEFADLNHLNFSGDLESLQKFLSDFITYQLERQVNSESFVV